jgi:hypothetical protein
MPGDYKGATIDRDGQRLMERPLEITNEVRALELRKAREQVNQKEAQIRGQPAGASSPFEGNRDATFIKRSREATIPMAIPK